MTSTLDWMAQRIGEIEQAAVEKERERIIKILEDKQYFAGFLLWFAQQNPSAEDALAAKDTVIALIKGENK